MAKEDSKGQNQCLILGLKGKATNGKTPETQRVWDVLKGAQWPLWCTGSWKASCHKRSERTGQNFLQKGSRSDHKHPLCTFETTRQWLCLLKCLIFCRRENLVCGLSHIYRPESWKGRGSLPRECELLSALYKVLSVDWYLSNYHWLPVHDVLSPIIKHKHSEIAI